MHFFSSFRAQGISVGLCMATGALLTACAFNPANQAVPLPQAPAPAAGSTAFTGRMMLTVVDQNGAPLEGATVDLRATGPGFYRTTARTDHQGIVNFSAVPPQVEVNVVPLNGGSSSTQIADVEPRGVSQLRVMVQTYGDDTQQDTSGQNAAPGGVRIRR